MADRRQFSNPRVAREPSAKLIRFSPGKIAATHRLPWNLDPDTGDDWPMRFKEMGGFGVAPYSELRFGITQVHVSLDSVDL